MHDQNMPKLPLDDAAIKDASVIAEPTEKYTLVPARHSVYPGADNPFGAPRSVNAWTEDQVRHMLTDYAGRMAAVLRGVIVALARTSEYGYSFASHANQFLERNGYGKTSMPDRPVDMFHDYASLLPGTWYMDPPDGGDVTVFEQLKRMSEDARKWRKLSSITDATINEATVRRLGGWESFKHQWWACKVVRAVMTDVIEPVKCPECEFGTECAGEPVRCVEHASTTPVTGDTEAFNAAWPKIHKAGFNNGWRGVALTAWELCQEAMERNKTDVIDLEKTSWDAITQAASESNWMPPEYFVNDWVADVCGWLRDGPPQSSPAKYDPNTIYETATDETGKPISYGARSTSDPRGDTLIMYAAIEFHYAAKRGVNWGSHTIGNIVISPANAGATMSDALCDVIAERKRHVSVLRWTPEQDDLYTDGQLAVAGACYAFYSTKGADAAIAYGQGRPKWWPWDAKWWKPTTPRKMLVKAAALLLAEIERIDRRTEKNNA